LKKVQGKKKARIEAERADIARRAALRPSPSADRGAEDVVDLLGGDEGKDDDVIF
jgi:hypothetical protein